VIKLKYLSIFFISCSIAMGPSKKSETTQLLPQKLSGSDGKSMTPARAERLENRSFVAYTPAGVDYIKLTLKEKNSTQNETQKIQEMMTDHEKAHPHSIGHIAGIKSLETLHKSNPNMLRSKEWYLIIGSNTIDFFTPLGIPLSDECDLLWKPILIVLNAKDIIDIWSLSNGDLKRSSSIYFKNEQSNRDKFLAFFKNSRKQQINVANKIELGLATLPYALLFVQDLRNIPAGIAIHCFGLINSVIMACAYCYFESPRGIITFFAQFIYSRYRSIRNSCCHKNDHLVINNIATIENGHGTTYNAGTINSEQPTDTIDSNFSSKRGSPRRTSFRAHGGSSDEVNKALTPQISTPYQSLPSSAQSSAR